MSDTNKRKPEEEEAEQGEVPSPTKRLRTDSGDAATAAEGEGAAADAATAAEAGADASPAAASTDDGASTALTTTQPTITEDEMYAAPRPVSPALLRATLCLQSCASLCGLAAHTLVPRLSWTYLAVWWSARVVRSVRLIHKREQARAKKNWGDADEIREQLRARGVELYDKNHEWVAQDGRKGVIPIGAAGAGSITAGAACTLSDAEIITKINEREDARGKKDFATSDQKREELRAAGVDVFDKDRCWKTNDGRQGRIGVSVEAHLAGATQAMGEAEIDARLQQREQARAQKDWATADQIREELRARGIELYDQTSMWKASDGRVGMLPAQPGRTGAGLAGMLAPALAAPVMAAAGLANPALSLMAAGGGVSTLSDQAIFALIEEREQARKSKNWAVADKIREGMRARGVEVFDKTGQWRASDGRQGTIVGAGVGGVSAAGMAPPNMGVVAAAAAGGLMGGGAGGGGGGGGGAGGAISEAEIAAYLDQREIHRANKNWAQADVIRTTLRQAGVDIYDKEARWTTRDGRSGTIAGAGQGGAGGGADAGAAAAAGGAGVPTPMQVAAHMQMQQQMQQLRQQGIGAGASAAAVKLQQQQMQQYQQQMQMQQYQQQQQAWYVSQTPVSLSFSYKPVDITELHSGQPSKHTALGVLLCVTGRSTSRASKGNNSGDGDDHEFCAPVLFTARTVSSSSKKRLFIVANSSEDIHTCNSGPHTEPKRSNYMPPMPPEATPRHATPHHATPRHVTSSDHVT
jgi:cysteinyl-tRNA synthetase